MTPPPCFFTSRDRDVIGSMVECAFPLRYLLENTFSLFKRVWAVKVTLYFSVVRITGIRIMPFSISSVDEGTRISYV